MEMLPKADYWALNKLLVQTGYMVAGGMIAIASVGVIFQADIAFGFGFLGGMYMVLVICLVAIQEALFRCKCGHVLHKHEKENGEVYPNCKGRRGLKKGEVCQCSGFEAKIQPLTKEGKKAIQS